MNDPLMYVVLVGLVILVVAFILPKTSKGIKGDASPQVLKEMEETMDHFLAELEEDNHKLLDTIAVMKQEHESAIYKVNARVEELEKQFQEQRQEWNRLALQRLEQQEALLEKRWAHEAGSRPDSVTAVEADNHVQAAPEEEPDRPLSIKARYEELFQLHDDGKSIEYIAKKTGMNKGEVSLIIQLAQQEGR